VSGPNPRPSVTSFAEEPAQTAITVKPTTRWQVPGSIARHSWSRRSTKWSADDSSRSSRCNGRCAGPIFCCRPGRGSSTRIWTTYSAVGIQNSGRHHKRRSQSARRLDPRLFGALLLIIIEDTAEIQCAAKDFVQYHTSPERGMTQLVRMALRMRPDRILLGEVRGPEALDLLMIWNTGHEGGIATLHANNAAAGLTRPLNTREYAAGRSTRDRTTDRRSGRYRSPYTTRTRAASSGKFWGLLILIEQIRFTIGGLLAIKKGLYSK
jgi:hypothetical protein